MWLVAVKTSKTAYSRNKMFSFTIISSYYYLFILKDEFSNSGVSNFFNFFFFFSRLQMLCQGKFLDVYAQDLDKGVGFRQRREGKSPVVGHSNKIWGDRKYIKRILEDIKFMRFLSRPGSLFEVESDQLQTHKPTPEFELTLLD